MATTLVNDSAVDRRTTAPTHLTWLDAQGRSHAEPIADGATTVGAGPRCVVRLAAEGAWPLHCVLQRTDSGVMVRRWSNDTNLNGESFTEAPLQVGDRLTVAGTELSVESLGSLPGLPEKLETATPAVIERDLRVAVQAARGRTRRVLRALREERMAAAQAALQDNDSQNNDALNRQHDLAAKLMLATTELDDCRTDLEQARLALDAATIEASDGRWLFAAAQVEVDELERRVASLLDEVEALTSERSLPTGQPEPLETGAVAREERLADASIGTPEPAIEESGFDDPEAETRFGSIDNTEVSSNPWSAVPEEAPSEVDWAIETDAADESTPLAEDDGSGPAEPAVPTEEFATTPDVDNPWSGDWGSEPSTQAPPIQEPPANGTAMDEVVEQTADAWLDSFQNSAADEPSKADPFLSAEAPIQDAFVEETPVAETPVKETAPDAFDEPADENATEEAVESDPAGDEVEASFAVSSILEKAGILAPSGLEEVAQPEPAVIAPSGQSSDEPSEQASDDPGLGSVGLPVDVPEEQPPSEPAPFGFASASGGMPESVDDLIADEQPSAEAPVSFLDKYADTLPADDVPPQPAPPAPEPPMLQQPAFDAPAPAGGEGEPGEESIEDYMAKLMQRMRGEEAAPAAAPTAGLVADQGAAGLAQTPQPTVKSSATDAQPEAAPLTDLKELRSGPAPEQATDMSTLRALANQSARNAIGVSEGKVDREQANVTLTIAGIAMACGVFLAATAPRWNDWSVFAGVAGFGWAAYWFYGTLRLILSARTKEATQKGPTLLEEPQDKMPIAPAE